MSLILPANTQHQLLDQWCWAAVASTVSYFYNNNHTGFSQGAIAGSQIDSVCNGIDSTNNDNAPALCDKAWDLASALGWAGNLVPGGDISRALSYAEAVAQIQSGFIFCCQLIWGTNFSHFVLVCGFDDSGNLIVGDPASDNPVSNNHSVSYNELLSNYSSGGKWQRTIGTQARQ